MLRRARVRRIAEGWTMYDDDDDYDDELEHADPYDDDGDYDDGTGFGIDDDDGDAFADPGGRSALRAATRDNPRNLSCPNCGAPNRLTPADVARGYQCDACADRAEQGW